MARLFARREGTTEDYVSVKCSQDGELLIAPASDALSVDVLAVEGSGELIDEGYVNKQYQRTLVDATVYEQWSVDWDGSALPVETITSRIDSFRDDPMEAWAAQYAPIENDDPEYEQYARLDLAMYYIALPNAPELRVTRSYHHMGDKTLFWLPLWDFDIGEPAAPAVKEQDSAVRVRQYTNGRVIMNYTDSPVTLPLGSWTYTDIDEASYKDTITIQPMDGAILRKDTNEMAVRSSQDIINLLYRAGGIRNTTDVLNVVYEAGFGSSTLKTVPAPVAGGAPIQDAIDQITDAEASKPYCVLVHPGIYTENLDIPAHVSVLGMFRRSVGLVGNVTVAAGGEINNIEVTGSVTGGSPDFEVHIPFITGGSPAGSSSTSWASWVRYGAWWQPANYREIMSAYFTAMVYPDTADRTSHVRLYDETNDQPIVGSELTHNAAPPGGNADAVPVQYSEDIAANLPTEECIIVPQRYIEGGAGTTNVYNCRLVLGIRL